MRVLIKEIRALIEDSGKVPLHDLLNTVSGALNTFRYMVKGRDSGKGKSQTGIWSRQTAEVKPHIMRIFDRLDYHIISPWVAQVQRVGMALWLAAGKPKPATEASDSLKRAKKVLTTVPKMPMATLSPLAELQRAEQGLKQMLAREGENAEVDALLSGASQILPMVTKAIAEIESL